MLLSFFNINVRNIEMYVDRNIMFDVFVFVEGLTLQVCNLLLSLKSKTADLIPSLNADSPGCILTTLHPKRV